MENKHQKKKIALALMPVLVLSLAVLFSFDPGSFSATEYNYGTGSSVQSGYGSEDQRSETRTHEPVYISIFKFIVNCNPFQKETQQ